MFQTRVAEKIKAHILCSVTFFPPKKSCRLWHNVGKCYIARQVIDDSIIRRMRCPCWVTKAINAHSQYLILIAFPLKQWLRERAWNLRYTYIACLFILHLILLFPHSASDLYPSFLHPSLPFFFPLLLGIYFSPFPFIYCFASQFPSYATGQSRTRREATRRFSLKNGSELQMGV